VGALERQDALPSMVGRHVALTTLGRVFPVVACALEYNRKGYMATLFHSVDNNSTKSDKHVPHGTAVIKLVGTYIASELRRLASEK
jgi:hypothetical protein